MKILLDTNAFLWAVSNDPQLSARARTLIDDHETTMFFSVAGIWEIVIKTQIGRLKFPKPVVDYVIRKMVEHSVKALPIDLKHMRRLEMLPPYHRDPFDRVMLAQCLEEDLAILSSDKLLKRYPVRLIW